VNDSVPDFTPVEKLKNAIQDFAVQQSDIPVLIDTAVVVFEMVAFDPADEGKPMRKIQYAVPTDNFSMSSALGLLAIGITLLERDVLDDQEDEE
jgi:hypothetical protein